MNGSQIQEHLRWLGWSHLRVDGVIGNVSEQAVSNFQAGFAYYDLAIDGDPGRNTQRALIEAVGRKLGPGTASPHFSFIEVQCKCGGRYRNCQRVKADRATFRGLEKYRAALGGGVTPLSGYRCYYHNRAVGGATQSRHLVGDAVDLTPVLSLAKVKSLGAFTGIGWQLIGGVKRVRHVDTRPGGVVDWSY